MTGRPPRASSNRRTFNTSDESLTLRTRLTFQSTSRASNQEWSGPKRRVRYPHPSCTTRATRDVSARRSKSACILFIVDCQKTYLCTSGMLSFTVSATESCVCDSHLSSGDTCLCHILSCSLVGQSTLSVMCLVDMVERRR